MHDSIQKAASLLKSGGVGVVPTETVYGLAGNALDPTAIRRIYKLKNRPTDHPLIVHVATLEQAIELTEEFPARAMEFAARFWPGPLTLVLPVSPHVPREVTGGLPSIAIRMPNHEFVSNLLLECGLPLAAPSANLFGNLSPTRVENLDPELLRWVDFVLDGGPCSVGVESTIVSLLEATPKILRPGGIPLELLREVSPQIGVAKDEKSIAPGMLPKHYSPRTRLVLWTPDFKPKKGQKIASVLVFPGAVPYSSSKVSILSVESSFEEAANTLYAILQDLDQLGFDLIVAHLGPEKDLGVAINDRLRRASFAAE